MLLIVADTEFFTLSSFAKIIDYDIYTLDFIPLYDDFKNKKVGYIVVFAKSDYLKYFGLSIVGSIISIFVISFLFGYTIYFNQKVLIKEKEKQRTDLINNKLLSSNQLIRSVLNGTNDLIFYKDKNFRYLGCNKSFCNFVGKQKDEIVGFDDYELFDEKVATQFRSMDNIILKENKVSSNYEWVTYPNGDEAYLYTQKIPFRYDGENFGILGISRDLTELYKVQMELKNQTYIDELTKINNRKSYNKRLYELLEEFKRYDVEFSMVMFDIDNFKSINDTYGHKIGDDVLIELSKIVSLNIRKNDYFFRIGGEEFVILLANTTLAHAVVLADKVREDIEQNLKIIEDRIVTISVGVTTVVKDDTEDKIFTRVDNYLYKAKESGKNKVVSDLG